MPQPSASVDKCHWYTYWYTYWYTALTLRMKETLDAALEPLLLQQKFKQGGTEMIKASPLYTQHRTVFIPNFLTLRVLRNYCNENNDVAFRGVLFETIVN